jgi:glycerol-3-phosphate dehydrogenase (NAD(P)+)
MRITVLGSGSWGTALAISMAEAGQDVVMWTRSETVAETLRDTRRNASYLPESRIPTNVVITASLAEALRDVEIIVVAVPSQVVRAVVAEIRPWVGPHHIIVSVAKGIEHGSLLTTTEVIRDVLFGVACPVGVLYGPSHAEEVAHHQPTTIVAAFEGEAVAARVQAAFHAPWLRVYRQSDVKGVEIGGSVKNVMAIAAGVLDGMGYGDNAKAALITRGIAEITRLGLALGARAETFSGLSGLGDLVVTCMSQHSRNRYVGEAIGKGERLESIQGRMKMVAEGVETTRSVYQLASRFSVEMPITESVYQVLFEGKSVADSMSALMQRSLKDETGPL